MKLEVRRLSAMALIALMTISAVIIYAQPKIPHQFYGQVTIGGEPAIDGTLVEARIDGVTYAEIPTVGGRYGYEPTFKVPADDLGTTEVEGGVDGDTVEFYVNGVWAVNHAFLSGEVTELPLEPTIPFEIFLYEGWNLIGLPLISQDPSIEAVLSDILPFVESVWAYDGETKEWSSYSPGAPSDLTQILAGKGYWINTITDVVWTMYVPGYYGQDQFTIFERVEIQSGWSEKDATGWTVTLQLKNTGSATATMAVVFLDDMPLNATDGTTLHGYGLNAYPTDPDMVGTDIDDSGTTLKSGESLTVHVWIRDGYATLSSGTTINIKIHSAAGMDYIKLIELV